MNMPQASAVETALINFDQIIVTESSVPLAFTDDDILQFIVIEQAQLFPTLDQEIYFDFLIKNVDEENKKITIVAGNVKDCSNLAKTVLFLKIDHPDFERFNLLPWRQREKQRVKKRELKILGIVAAVTGLIMLIISFFYIHIAYENNKKLTLLSHRKKIVISKLVLLEKSNLELQSLVNRWNHRINIAQQQADLVVVLKAIKVLESENMVLEKIIWNKGVLLIYGKAETREIIKVYLAHLVKNKINGRVKLMEISDDHVLPVKFEIEAKEVLV